MESYRTARGPRQRVVAYLGELDERGRLGVGQRAQGRNPSWQTDLFQDAAPEYVEVDLKGVRVERSRQFGGCWLGLTVRREWGLPELLEGLLPPGREEVPWAVMALGLVLGRLLEGCSERHSAEHG